MPLQIEESNMLSSNDGFGDLGTYELLNGTNVDPNITPIKYTQLKDKKGT